MTTFLNHFKVDKNLLEVDFFDPNLETDTRLYIVNRTGFVGDFFI